MKMDFKVGDKVIVRKPKNVNQWPEWNPAMDMFENKQYNIAEIGLCYPDSYARLKNIIFFFNVDWLEKIENKIDTISLKELNSRPDSVSCHNCGTKLKNPCFHIKFCPKCEG
jgi:hypothetical protein